jgi:histidinol-phosphate aminotransferase
MSNAVSRRSFIQLAAAASAAAAIPIITEAQLAYAQTRAKLATASSRDAVMINANENPLGPCASAREAIARITPEGGRYHNDLTEELIHEFATMEKLDPDCIQCYGGSSSPLHYTVLAFTSPQRGFITGDPGYEAGTFAAKLSGAKVYQVPLVKGTYAHDVKAMVAADPNAGVIYITNPNNPTGTTTSREEIQYALDNKPHGSVLLIDEAYIHFSDAQPSLDLVRAGKEVIVLRTFSKLYGMAGLRCGLAIGRPDLLARVDAYNGWNSPPVTAVAAAIASLRDTSVVATRKKINADARAETFAWLTKNGYSFVPSQSNCFMLNTGRNGNAVKDAMQQHNIYVGRVWPSWPSYVRVTVGTPAEMAQFCSAYKQVTDAPVSAHLEPPRYAAERHLPLESRRNILS